MIKALNSFPFAIFFLVRFQTVIVCLQSLRVRIPRGHPLWMNASKLYPLMNSRTKGTSSGCAVLDPVGLTVFAILLRRAEKCPRFIQKFLQPKGNCQKKLEQGASKWTNRVRAPKLFHEIGPCSGVVGNDRYDDMKGSLVLSVLCLRLYHRTFY